MTNIEIRRKILEMVYEKFKEHPYYRITPKEFKEALNIDLKTLNFNIVYLEEKGYIELEKPLEGSLFVGARITSKGIDLVEDEYQFDITFPVDKDTSAMQINVYKEFNLLIEKISTDEKISSNTKEILIEEIREIQKELKKIEPSYNRVKTFLDKIRQHNFEIGNQVLALLKNPVIFDVLAKSAKKEL
ncbi:MAG: hypothetical protein N3A65_01730 [candidate division WOR-3 bacterium]|nr:hypothetical protein [candidate division WOR-3 bacterium]